MPDIGPILRSHDAFDAYHRRFAEAVTRLPAWDPAAAADREAIAREARHCLGIEGLRPPEVDARPVHRRDGDGFAVEFLQGRSWRGAAASALLYQPDRPALTPTPLVLLCCGHGRGGKLAPMYQVMARHLARRGMVVLCPDNLGQGEREPMGHRGCTGPFACGTSLQGLIVLETRGWIDWALRRPDVDPVRVAAIGNSGGGTLTLFLAALEPRLAALACSGYPSTFEFVARKEKTHCHCNLLPGIVGRLEMHHLLGCAAPRPLLIFQGRGDALFPPDLFHVTARRVHRVYRQLDADDRFAAHVVDGAHRWDTPRVRLTGEFLARAMQLPAGHDAPIIPDDESLLPPGEACYPRWPADALDVDRLAAAVTGRPAEPPRPLWEIFPPAVDNPDALVGVHSRGDPRQVLAQFEAFLGGYRS